MGEASRDAIVATSNRPDSRQTQNVLLRSLRTRSADGPDVPPFRSLARCRIPRPNALSLALARRFPGCPRDSPRFAAMQIDTGSRSAQRRRRQRAASRSARCPRQSGRAEMTRCVWLGRRVRRCVRVVKRGTFCDAHVAAATSAVSWKGSVFDRWTLSAASGLYSTQIDTGVISALTIAANDGTGASCELRRGENPQTDRDDCARPAQACTGQLMTHSQITQNNTSSRTLSWEYS